MTPVATFVTNEAEGRSTFVQTQKITGDLVAVDIMRNKNPVPGGRNQGTMRCAAVFKFQNIVEIVQEDGTEPDAKEWSVRFDYSQWDMSNARAMPPERRGDWFTFVVPTFTEQGIDLNDPTNEETGLEPRLNKQWTFELKSFERDYSVVQRDPVSNSIMYTIEPGSEEAANIDPGELDEAGGVPLKAPALYSNLFPTVIPSAGSTEDEVMAHATTKYAELNAGDSEENLETFVAWALDDNIISDSTKIRRSIQNGKFTPTN